MPFTPGPWTYAREGSSKQMMVRGGPEGIAIARCYSYAPTEANARLIAAAPRMYALLDWLERHCDGATGARGEAHAAEGSRIRAELQAVLKAAQP
ncbi:MAG TPA: hypothetical protein VGW34_10625 [Allosphingosinicella sp.]|nr:hypothetical protein [Allosphingosinicella sp.]